MAEVDICLVDLGDSGGPRRGLIPVGIAMVAEVDGREAYWLYGD